MDSCATHVPVLKHLAKKRIYTKIVEFGCGNYSTATFLDKNIFPDLKELISLETDKKWLRKIKQAMNDTRLRLIYGKDIKLIEISKGWTADLVFVDGHSYKTRVKTCIHAGSIAPIVVLHDSETPGYLEKISPSFTRFEVFDNLTPHTAVFYKDNNAR